MRMRISNANDLAVRQPSTGCRPHGCAANLGRPIFEEPRVTLDPKNLHLFGVRAVDRGERELLQARGVDMSICADSTSSAPLC